MVAETMWVAYILKEEYNLETRILNIHTVKPIDKKAIIKVRQSRGGRLILSSLVRNTG